MARRNYFVSANREEWLAVEETLADTVHNITDVERPMGRGIFKVFLWVCIILYVALMVGVWKFSVYDHAIFAEASARNRTVHISVPPPRGVIVDRNYTALVENVPSFDVLVVAKKVRRAEDGSFLDVSILADALQENAEDLALRLQEGVRKQAVFFIATNILRDRALTLRTILPSGFSLITSTKRNYINGPQFSHIIGYTGKVSTDDIVSDTYYTSSDSIGRAGVEASFEDDLRGTHGALVYSDQETQEVLAPRSGNSLVLAVDASVQKKLWSTVWDAIRTSNVSGAAAIAQDPRDGSVLGLVSFPSYDNNVFTEGRNESVQKILNDTHRPLFNRVVSGLYNPGSTIKPLFGMAALEASIVAANQIVTNGCTELIVPNPSNPENPYVFGNWRRDSGPFNLFRAIADSCNIYFYLIGGGSPAGDGSQVGLGIERMARYLRDSGADSALGIQLFGEEAGFIPTPEWKEKNRGQMWYQGDTYNTAIGQGDLVVTPLWINSYISAIANGGTIWQPRIALRVERDDGTIVRHENPIQFGQLPFSNKTIEQMRIAMSGVVSNGTAKILADLPVRVAAKTGTAEVIKGRSTNSLVTVWGPTDNPTIAVTFLFEGSESSRGIALQAAHYFLASYFR